MIIYYAIKYLPILTCIWSYLYYKKNKPKEYSVNKIGNGNGNDNDIKKRYSKKKIPKDIDVIVIGSGMAGLTCAGILSRVGKRVLVLEQHYITGGCTHSFIDKEYEFDTGLHYVGNVNKINKILNLITYSSIKWDQMGKDNNYLYDEIYVEDKNLNLRAGEEQLLNEIKEKFPNEVENVRAYLKDVKKTAKYKLYFILKILKIPFIRKIVDYLNLNKTFFYSINQSAEERIQQYIKDKYLQALLLGQFGDSGEIPSKEPFYIQAGITDHYLNGGYYPRGGTSIIAKSIVPIIRSTGGDVLVSKPVKSILIENNEAYGIEMYNGDKIYAKKIISACGVRTTWTKLVEPKYVPNRLLENINNCGLSTAALYLFVGMNKSSEELNLRSSNIWHLPNINYEEMINKFNEDPINNEGPIFIGFPSAKDSDWDNRFPDKSNAVVISLINYDYFKKWENTKLNKRGEDYDEIKSILTEKILQVLYKYYPQIEGNIDYLNLATPLTFNYYLNSNKGEIYGINCSKNRFMKNDWLLPETHIKNLYQTGVDILSFGISGAISSGVLTSYSILGYGTLFDTLTNRDLMDDMMNL